MTVSYGLMGLFWKTGGPLPLEEEEKIKELTWTSAHPKVFPIECIPILARWVRVSDVIRGRSVGKTLGWALF